MISATTIIINNNNKHQTNNNITVNEKELINNNENPTTTNNQQTAKDTEKANEESVQEVEITSIKWIQFYFDGNPNTGADVTIYVGEEYAGHYADINLIFSRDGQTLDSYTTQDNKISKDGTIEIKTTNPIPKYPDNCQITFTHNNQKINKECNLKTQKGTQRINLS